MKRQSKAIKFICSICLTLAMLVSVVPAMPVTAAEATTTEITSQDIIKMSEALNMSTDSEVYDIGTNPYRIFDVNNAGFASLFVSSKVTDFKNYSFSGNSRAAISSEYSRERAFGSGVDINVPIYDNVNFP
jgi:hypothetical protein